MISKTWGHGLIELGEVNSKTAGYCAEYVVKKMTMKDDSRLEGRYPEFARMSRRPGLGYFALGHVSEAMRDYLLDDRPDVPAGLRHGSAERPFGRYMRGRLRELKGRDRRAPIETLQAIEERMRPLREAARASKECPSLAGQIIQAGEGKRAEIRARNLILKQRRSL